MYIGGLNKTTLLDYPEHIAATIFFTGCNFRCPFCHNRSLILEKEYPSSLSQNEILTFLKKRSFLLEGVCITGGEPTIQKDLPDFIEAIKKLGLKVKLDTNGSNPDMLQYLLQKNLLDYVAMDIKNSLEKYPLTIGHSKLTSFSTKQIETSVHLLRNSSIPYEFRTTIVKELHTHEDIHNIGKWLKNSPIYFLQSFENSKEVLTNELSSHTKETLLEFQTILSSYIKQVTLRGI